MTTSETSDAPQNVPRNGTADARKGDDEPITPRLLLLDLHDDLLQHILQYSFPQDDGENYSIAESSWTGRVADYRQTHGNGANWKHAHFLRVISRYFRALVDERLFPTRLYIKNIGKQDMLLHSLLRYPWKTKITSQKLFCLE